MGRIVVGVDGSPAADAALRFALAEARLRNADLRIVCAWEIPNIGPGSAYFGAGLAKELENEAERIIDASLARIGADTSGLVIEREARRGNPAETLLEAAFEADLLVVGSRGRGGFASLLLGSVSQQVAHHAACPVVIVHPPLDGSAGPE